MINTFMRFGGLGRLARQIALSVLALGALTCAHAGETVTFFHNDIAGTPMLATDVNGNPVWKETYRPYGDRLVKASTSNNNKLWFTGKSYDEQTGLSYMGARYYDPALGRFMGIDPAPVDVSNVHSSNRYAYANNNPYRYVDPTGEIPLDTLWDAGNVVYDLGKITVGWTTGNQAWVVSGGKDLLLDAGAMALPYVPAGTQKIGREVVEQGIKLADKAGVANWKSVKQFGHTFSEHGAGAKNTERLMDRARGTGNPQGQWLDNQAAAKALSAVKVDGPATIRIPEGLGQVVKPDGTIVKTEWATVVPSGDTLRTAYPVLRP